MPGDRFQRRPPDPLGKFAGFVRTVIPAPIGFAYKPGTIGLPGKVTVGRHVIEW